MKYYIGLGGDYRTDTFRDLYNNAVGRQIGAYAKEHNLSDEQVAELVHQALLSGDLLKNIRSDGPDPRVPNVNSDPFFDFTPNDFNGWPGDFRTFLKDIRWREPSTPPVVPGSDFNIPSEAFPPRRSTARPAVPGGGAAIPRRTKRSRKAPQPRNTAPRGGLLGQYFVGPR